MSGALAPRFEKSGSLHLIGLSQTYKDNTSATGIPQQWQRFAPHIDNIDGQKGGVTYGVCWMQAPDVMTYLTAVETEDTAHVPEDFTRAVLAPQRYAIFRHDGPVSDIRRTWTAIFETWLPTSGVERADAPDFELYSADFNPMASTGYVEIWIPLKS